MNPLVSVVVPIHNEAEHLAECLDSILAQTYTNWCCTIVDNCSTDASGDLAQRYAERDSRFQVRRTGQLLRAVANHNMALRAIAPASKYCKIVFGDDWIFPECLERMVSLAEQHPTVGIVGAYGLQDHEVMWTGLPYPSWKVSGRDVCRRLLLEGTYVFGTSGSLLFRSDLVRSHDPFFNEGNFHADMEACFVLLKSSDFGFVHQVLTCKRNRPRSLGSITDDLHTLIAGHLHNLVVHGKDFLTPEEFAACLQKSTADYYNFLAVSLLFGRRDKKFWEYHKRKLTESGVGFSRGRLARRTLVRALRALLNPGETADKLNKHRGMSSQMKSAENTKPLISQSAGCVVDLPQGSAPIARSAGKVCES